MTRTEYGPLPRLNITEEILTEAIFQILKGRTGGINFNSIANAFKQLVDADPEKYGVSAHPNVRYQGGLDRNDISRIREIIWDWIILRYLTPGNYQDDKWPELSITKKGQLFFAGSDPQP